MRTIKVLRDCYQKVMPVLNVTSTNTMLIKCIRAT